MNEFVSSVEPTSEDLGKNPTKTDHRGRGRFFRNTVLFMGGLALVGCAATSPVGISSEPLNQEPIRPQQTVATPTPEPDSESLILPGTVNSPFFINDCPVEVIASADGIVFAELHRSDTDSTGRIYGPGFSVLNQGANGFLFFKVGEQYPEQGFDLASGGFGPGDELKIRTYINGRYPDGNYSGAYMLEFTTPEGYVICRETPTLQYLIDLKD